MGLDSPAEWKKLLRSRLPGGWLTNGQWLKKQTEHAHLVQYALLDFLLHIHQIAHINTLTYEILMSKLKSVFTHFMASFPNMHTMILLLDEEEYTPLGKVPTQKARKDSLTMEERKCIVEGGVMEEVDHSVIESIEDTFSSHPDVAASKRTAFSVFFSKYVRTRALRKDMVRMITKCLMDLFSDGKMPSSLRVYIDGMAYSSYYAPSHSFFQTEDAARNGGTGSPSPMLKRRHSVSSNVGDIQAHSHKDGEHLRVCRLVRREEDDRVEPVWFSVEDGDNEIFHGFSGTFDRPNMGESDIKIPYYLWKIAEMLHSIEEEEDAKTSIYISSWDTDCIPISLLAMDDIHRKFPSVVDSLSVLLDTKQGGSCWDLLSTSSKKSSRRTEFSLSLNRNVFPHEDEFLSDIVSVGHMVPVLRDHFRVFHPGFSSGNEIEVYCLFMIVGGTDYVNSLSGIGTSAVRVVFDVGGYRLLSEAVTSRNEDNESHRSIQMKYDESKIRAFYNLCLRYNLGVGQISKVKTAMTKEKTKLTKQIKELKTSIEAMTMTEMREEAEEDLREKEKERAFLNGFLWMDHHQFLIESSASIEEGDEKAKEKLVEYIDETTGIGQKEADAWEDIFGKMIRKRRERIKKARDKMAKEWKKGGEEGPNPLSMKDDQILDTLRADVTDLLPLGGKEKEGGLKDLETRIRRVVWNMIYWKISPFVCLRETKAFRSTAIMKGTSVYGYESVSENGKRTIALSKTVSRPQKISLKL
jgi:hypothetical protein